MKTTLKSIKVSPIKNILARYGVLIALQFFALTAEQQSSLTAIGNVSGAPAEMKQSELKAVLMGETQRWKNGKRVVIALMKTSTPLGKTTSSKIYDMSGDELNKYWLALVFQGKAQAPVFFTSVSELQNFVAQNPGAIGIIDKPTASADVRALIIDGKPSF
ncbi:MAG: hypothetical protein EOO48_12860 [Flavobacterium sp.]|nr:MAG: hypothetical protein EOO48_12860 [Flavobacterium sp.]